MICPSCRSDECRRSKRHGLWEHALGLTRARPWRCHTCSRRFWGWSVPLVFVQYAHCARCGNLDLKRISREYVNEGSFRWLLNFLGAAAYRCAPCRFKFFSFRPYHPIPAEHYDYSSGQQSALPD